MLDNFITLGEIIPPSETPKSRILRDHIEYMRAYATSADHVVDPTYSWPDIHNFYAYCKHVGFDDSQVYPIMLLNGIRSNNDFTPEVTKLRVVQADVVSQILSTLTST